MFFLSTFNLLNYRWYDNIQGIETCEIGYSYFIFCFSLSWFNDHRDKLGHEFRLKHKSITKK